jgi:hypothetical protein
MLYLYGWSSTNLVGKSRQARIRRVDILLILYGKVFFVFWGLSSGKCWSSPNSIGSMGKIESKGSF